MNTTRRTPPVPAPSRIAGTLKVRPREPEAPAEAAPEAASPPPVEKRSRRPTPARGAQGGGAASAGERQPKAARAPATAPRKPASAARKAPAEQGTGPKRRSAAEGESRGDEVARPAGERQPRTQVVRRTTDRPPRAATPRLQPAPRSPAATAEGAPEGVRLSKVMAARGLCSRREADGLIERGWVFVDGRRITELGTRIDPGANITLAPEARNQQAERVTILLHKPVGYVSGQPEPGYEPAVVLVKAENQFDVGEAQNFHYSHLKGLAPAGRLDIDSTGLLVLTQDGRIARQLIGDDSKVDKEYLVRVEGELSDEGLALLNHGLELDGRKLRPAQVEWANPDQLRFVLREGRKRQIRRMCELVGLKVVGLKRVRIGKVRLADLPPGQWRFLREDERF